MNLLGKRLVIFGCGYVGGRIAHEALAQGIHVTALTRNVTTAAELRAQGVAVVVGNLAEAGWHSHLPGDADFVLNAVSSGGAGLDGYRQSYVHGMSSILRWAAAARKLETVVYTSSTSVYPQDGGMHVDEDASTDGVGERGQILVEAESLLRASAAASPRQFARAIILRLAGIYGPGRRHLVDQVLSGEVAGRREAHLNLIHRDDVCRAIWAAFQAPASVENGIFNVADDGAAGKGEIVDWLARELGVAVPRFTGIPAGVRRALTPDRIISNTKLKAVLGWQPQFADFRAGYKNMLAVRTD